MTRINTNVSSLVAQNTLGRSNASLNEALTRLSTGLRINTGKDDPAGLIASENLRSDITSIRRAISNTDRANQVIATADSALGQVSSLLNDIRGLVTESANSGALSDEQLSANQLQVDSSLEALNRIAQTTTFQGRRLLDGSLDFITSSTDTDFSNITDLQIDQANLGAAGEIDVDVTVSSAATQAQIDVENIPAAQAATAATGTLTFASETVGAQANVTDITFGTSGVEIQVTSATNANQDINSVVLAQGTPTGGNADASFNSTSGVLTITADFEAGAVSAADIADAIDDESDFATATVENAGNVLGPVRAEFTLDFGDGAAETLLLTAVAPGVTATPTAINLEQGTAGATYVGTTLTITGDFSGSGNALTTDELATIINNSTGTNAASGAFSAAGGSATQTDTVQVTDDLTTGAAIAVSRAGVAEESESILESTTGSAGTSVQETIEITQTSGNESNDTRAITIIEGTPTATVDVDFATNGTDIEVTVANSGTTALSAIVSALDTFFTDNDLGLDASVGTTATGDGNFDATAETSNVTDSLSGGAGATGGLAGDVVIELSGANGSEVFSFGQGTTIAELEAGIDLVSDATGVSATINGTTLELVSSGYGSASFVDLKVISEPTTGAVFTPAEGRDEGSDIAASVNGVSATGAGNEISINTATLDLSATLDPSFVGTASFTIEGGGALFQLGPDVVTNQQARLGIGSVNTARLGGASGKLFSLGTGGANELTSENLDSAAAIIEEAIDQVTSLRGRLGAFQRTTLETNKNALNDTLINLTDAESSIRDADFAAESAQLTRSQILVQSGTAVLQIANSNPQNVLALLG